jgi:hypothetical protein
MIPTLPLNTGAEIPRLRLGTARMLDRYVEGHVPADQRRRPVNDQDPRTWEEFQRPPGTRGCTGAACRT